MDKMKKKFIDKVEQQLKENMQKQDEQFFSDTHDSLMDRMKEPAERLKQYKQHYISKTDQEIMKDMDIVTDVEKKNMPGKGLVEIIQSDEYEEHDGNLSLSEFVEKLMVLKDTQIDGSSFKVELINTDKQKLQMFSDMVVFGIAVVNEKGESKTLDYLQHPENYKEITKEIEESSHDKPIT